MERNISSAASRTIFFELVHERHASTFNFCLFYLLFTMGAALTLSLIGHASTPLPATSPSFRGNGRRPLRIEPLTWHSTFPKSAYFWGLMSAREARALHFPVHRGYSEARRLIGNGSLRDFQELTDISMRGIRQIFEALENPVEDGTLGLSKIRLSDELQKWRQEQHAAGRYLPSKGVGLTVASGPILRLFGMGKFPKPLITNNTLFGSGVANFLIGAFDPETLYSNYCCDMGFFFEHGYHRAFPEFSGVVQDAIGDGRALATPGGKERRDVVAVGLRYIKLKIALEEQNKAKLADYTARMNRREAQILLLLDSSIMGMAAEAIARGFDPAAAMSDLIFSSPATDVVDVGSDMLNSEVMNSLLNVTDITASGIVSEDNLRKVYDAYACACARLFCERWGEPVARMVSVVYSWHIQNNRHRFYRRALLGWEKARKGPADQKEGDFDEVFDPEFRTTGFSRPLKDACDGRNPCNHVVAFVSAPGREEKLLRNLWWHLVTGPIEYAETGVIDAEKEEQMAESLRLVVAKTYAKGCVDEMAWILAHASHHAWQVNRLFEAAMFGSLLDDGGLRGKLDRTEHEGSRH